MTVVAKSPRPQRLKLAAALVAAVAFFSGQSASAQARLSLAERVAKLEQQAAGNNAQATQMELLQRINDLQTEMQQLRAMSEQQGFELEQLKKRAREQYLDLDSRLQRMSGQTPSTSMPPPSSMGNQAVNEPVDVRPNDTGAFGEPTSTVPASPSPPATAPTSPTNTAPATANLATERSDYDSAFESLKRGQYADASKRFESFLAKYPRGTMADSATYWLGESYYVTQKYSQALATFQGLLGSFPQSKKSPDSLLKVGYCYYQLGDTAKATTTLKSVMERYPDQPVAKLAEGRLRALQLK
jgi:tol-pal system protein YbgF